MSLITIAPVGGLCNRMRALDSALNLGKNIGSRVEMLWYLDTSLNCKYSDLFVAPDGLFRVIDVDVSGRFGLLRKNVLRALRSRAGRDLYGQSYIELAMQSGYNLNHEFFGKNVLIETCSRFYGCPDYQNFIPVQQIRTLVVAQYQKLQGAVGIHIRRSDNLLSIKHSPTEKFEKIIQQMIANEGCQQFFLSTDSPEEESRLRRRFPGKIFSNPKKCFDRNVGNSIKDALVDLYCLAECRKIVGSYWSSFSETAAHIGQKELVVVNVFAGDIPSDRTDDLDN